MLYVLYFGNRVLKRISMVIMAIFLSNFSDHTAKRPIAMCLNGTSAPF